MNKIKLLLLGAIVGLSMTQAVFADEMCRVNIFVNRMAESPAIFNLVDNNNTYFSTGLVESGEFSNFNVPCALIIGKRKESTNKKTSLNDALRDYDVAV